MGGTCGVETAQIGYLNEKYEGKLVVAWFDAHGDLNLPTTSPSGYFHGMVLRILLGDGEREIIEEINLPLRIEQVILVGSRENDPEEKNFIEKEKLHLEEGNSKESGLAICKWILNQGLKKIYTY
jgi:arginase